MFLLAILATVFIGCGEIKKEPNIERCEHEKSRVDRLLTFKGSKKSVQGRYIWKWIRKYCPSYEAEAYRGVFISHGIIKE